MIQRILCPTDLTQHSRFSMTYALRLAKENRAQLVLFHATSFPSLAQYPCVELYDQWEQWISKFKIDQLLADTERRLHNFVAATFRNESSGIAWKTRVALGRVAEEIVVAAVQEEVDLIVLARCKRRMLARVLTRSISETVSKNPPCPVLSIDAVQPIPLARGWRAPVLQEIAQNS